ncbi:MAG: hypothetical protein K2X72_34570 [Reyranella sp.]|nr:hypothetical protein [Reyranella sp.]
MNDKSGLKQVHDYRWPIVDWTIAQLTAPFERIAEQNGLAPENWIEDGLGESTGCTLQLSSGLVIQVLQRAHSLRHYGHGPLLNADIKDVHLAGIDRVLRLTSTGRTDRPRPSKLPKSRRLARGGQR